MATVVVKVTPAQRGRRFSRQLVRIVRELEAVRGLGEASVNVVHLAISFAPIVVCRRTVARDLDALCIAGMLTCERLRVWNGQKKRLMPVYSLATPVELQHRLELMRRLTKDELRRLAGGSEIATETELQPKRRKA